MFSIPTRHSLARTLDDVSEHFAPALLTAEKWRTVRGCCEHLPARLSSAVYLECRLGGRPREPVDVIFRVDGAGREILAGRDPAIRMAGPLEPRDGWSAMGELCRRWTQSGSLLHRFGSPLWLEMDLPPARKSPGVVHLTPSAFVGLCATLGRSPGYEAITAFLDEITTALLPRALSTETRRSLERVLGHRPSGARVPYLGIMLGRPEPTIRIYLRDVSVQRLGSYFREVGWPGSVSALEERIAQLRSADGIGGAAQVGMVHLDVGRGVEPRIGMEYTFARECQMRGRVEETSFLHRLVDVGLCSPEERDALLRWPGFERRTLSHELWPSLLIRRLNCVKVVFVPGVDLEAKAYLLVHHVHLDRRRLPRTGSAA